MCFSSIFCAQNVYSIDSKVTEAKTRGNIVILKQVVVQTTLNATLINLTSYFFGNFEKFSKRLFGFKHLYLKQITTKI